MTPRIIAVFCVAALTVAAPAVAQEWNELDEAQRAVLAPWQENWDELPQQRRQRLLEGAERWRGMTPDERNEVRKRLQAWNAMTPEEQERVRARLERFRAMPEDQRKRVREGMQRLRELSPEQRQRLRRRWEAMSQAERRAFLSGLAIGERMARRGWIDALAPEEREALRQIGAQLDRVQRWALRARLRGLPDAAARADYARRLIEADAETRTAMIDAAERELRQERRAR